MERPVTINPSSAENSRDLIDYLVEVGILRLELTVALTPRTSSSLASDSNGRVVFAEVAKADCDGVELPTVEKLLFKTR